jgi:hypothetical protein
MHVDAGQRGRERKPEEVEFPNASTVVDTGYVKEYVTGTSDLLGIQSCYISDSAQLC